MTYQIIEERCIGCGACESDCPSEAIKSKGELYFIDPEKCTGCVDFYDKPKCVEVCPVECIEVTPGHEQRKGQSPEKRENLNTEKQTTDLSQPEHIHDGNAKTELESEISSIAASMLSPHQITFINKSGKNALVWLIGPTNLKFEVPNNTNIPLKISPGKHYIKVRYGDKGNYSYMEGEEFNISQNSFFDAQTSITLHTVPDGNYKMQPISNGEFDS